MEIGNGIVRNFSIAGGNHCMQPNGSVNNNTFVHQSDFSAATTVPINTYACTTSAVPVMHDYVDCTWGSFADSNKVFWTNGATFPLPTTSYTEYETYSLQIQVSDLSSIPISGALCYLSSANTPVFNYSTNPDGYIAVDYGTVSSGTTAVLNDTAKTWSANQYFFNEVLLTSGTGVGQRRIIKYGGTATQQPMAWNFTVAPDVTTNYCVIPYVRVKAYNPNAATLNTGVYSTVTDNNPFTLTLAAYGKIAQVVTLSISGPVVGSYQLVANPFLVASYSVAGAISTVTINGATKTITPSSLTTDQNLYDFSQWWRNQASNVGYSDPLVATDSSDLQLTTGWKLISGYSDNSKRITGGTLAFPVIGTYTPNIGTTTLSFGASSGTYDLHAATITGTVTLVNTGGGILTVLLPPSTPYVNTGPNITVSEVLENTLTISGVINGSNYYLFQTSNPSNILASGTQSGSGNIVIANILIPSPPINTTLRVRLPGYIDYETYPILSGTSTAFGVSQTVNPFYTP